MNGTEYALDCVEILLTPDDKRLLQSAAASKVVSLETFIRNAALETERTVVGRTERVVLGNEDAKGILAAQDKPFVPNAALRKAMVAAEEIMANSEKA